MTKQVNCVISASLYFYYLTLKGAKLPVYLIGGPPKCGKTHLAKVLSKRFSIPWISADTLQNIVYAYMDQGDHERFFPHSYLKGESNDETYRDNAISAIVAGYISQAKTCYKAISMVVETQLIDKDDYIIEGYQVTPEIAAEINDKFGRHNIKTMFLVRHDEQQFISDIYKSITPNDWIIRKTKEPATLVKIAKMVTDYSAYFVAEAAVHNMRTLCMDQDFAQSIEQAMSLLIK